MKNCIQIETFEILSTKLLRNKINKSLSILYMDDIVVYNDASF